MTPVSFVSPYGGPSWDWVSLPWEGITPLLTWIYAGVRVAPRQVTSISFVMGANELPDGVVAPPSPLPTPSYDFMFQEGNGTHAFQLRYKGAATTTGGVGWDAMIRHANSEDESDFSHGFASFGTIRAMFWYERLSTNFLQIVMMINNDGDEEVPIDAQISGALGLGGNWRSSVAIESMSQAVVEIVGLFGWNLTMVTHSLAGTPVTAVDAFMPVFGSWLQTSVPFYGSSDGFSFSWFNRVVPPRSQFNITTVLGVGEPPFQTPVPPTPHPVFPLMVQGGNSSRAFQVRWLGNRTTFGDNGWAARIRTASGRDAPFTLGHAQLGRQLSAQVQIVRLSDNYVRVCFDVINSGDRLDEVIDLTFGADVEVGGSDTPHCVINDHQQSVIRLVGADWTLNLVVRPIEGADDVTPIDNFAADFGVRDFTSTSLPYDADIDQIQLWWQGKTVPAGESLRLSFVVGVGEAPFTIPPEVTPGPVFPLQVVEGNSSFALQVRYNGQGTTDRDEGWPGAFRTLRSGEVKNFSGGVARDGQIHAQFFVEQLTDTWARAGFFVTNPTSVTEVVDLQLTPKLRFPTAPSFTFETNNQTVIAFTSDAFALSLITQPFGDLVISPMSGLFPAAGNFGRVGTPYSGAPAEISLNWLQQPVPPFGIASVSFIIGIEGTTPPTETPAPPEPRARTSMFAQDGNATSSTTGASFNLRYAGRPTTDRDFGWTVFVRRQGYTEVRMIGGAASVAPSLSAKLRYETISDTWTRLVIALNNSDAYMGFQVEVMMTVQLKLGYTIPSLQMNAANQVVLTFNGDWPLKMVVQPYPGLPDVTGVNRVVAEDSSWAAGSYPIIGNPQNMSFSWNVRGMTARSSLEYAVIFGTGDAPFDLPVDPTPNPTARPLRFVEGALGTAFDLLFHDEKTCIASGAWGAAIRLDLPSSVTTVYLSSGKARVGPLNVTTGYDQLSDNYIRIVYAVSNSGPDDATFDFVTYVQPRLGSDDEVGNVSIESNTQPMITLAGPRWSLNLLVKSIDTVDVTDISKFKDTTASFDASVAYPFSGAVRAMSISWAGLSISANSVRNVSFIVGVGPPPFDVPPDHTPAATHPPLVFLEGSSSGAFGLRLRDLPLVYGGASVRSELRIATRDFGDVLAISTASFGEIKNVPYGVSSIVSYDRVNPWYIAITTRITNVNASDRWVGLRYFWDISIEGVDKVGVVYTNPEQPVLRLVGGPDSDFVIVMRPFGGLDVTPISYFSTSLSGADNVATPFDGITDYVSIGWQNLRVPAGSSLDVVLVVGSGELPVTPPASPTPEPVYPLMIGVGNSTYAFQLRYNGLESTERDLGWLARLRFGSPPVMSSFSGGRIRTEAVTAVMQFERISDGFVRLVTVVENLGDTPQNASMQIYSYLRLGGDSIYGTVDVQSLGASVLQFNSQYGWNLTWITRAFPGANVTDLGSWTTEHGGWGQIPVPYNGAPSSFTVSWANRLVPAHGKTEFSTIFGVGTPPFQMPPSPTPGPVYALWWAPGNASYAFNMRYNGELTTLNANGYQGMLRNTGLTGSGLFSHGSVEFGTVSADVVEDRIDTNWVRVVTRVANSAETDAYVDVAFWGSIVGGGTTQPPSVELRTADQPFIDFVGPVWTLTALIGPISGLTIDRTRYFPAAGLYQQVSTPYAGNTGSATFGWTNVRVPAGRAIELAMGFGVRPAPFTIPPMATPLPPTSMSAQIGNSSYAFNAYWLGERTTWSNVGWRSTVRMSKQFSNTSSFSEGSLSWAGIRGQFRVEQVNDAWVRIIANMQNEGATAQMIDIMWSGDLWIGGNDVPRMAIQSIDQPVVTFVGNTWDLSVVVNPSSGLDVTSIDAISTRASTWTTNVEIPSNQTWPEAAFIWANRTLAPGESRDFSLLFGVGPLPVGPVPATPSRARTPLPGVPTPSSVPVAPSPVPGPPSQSPSPFPTSSRSWTDVVEIFTQNGYAMKLNVMGEPTCHAGQGWRGSMRVVGRTSPTSLSNGVATMPDANVTARLTWERLTTAWVRTTMSVTNTGTTPVPLDVNFGADIHVGGDDKPRLVVWTDDQPMFDFIGTNWSLTIVARDFPNARVTSIDSIDPTIGFAQGISAPYDGVLDFFTMQWLARTIEPGATSNFSLMFGTGEPRPFPFPPNPTPVAMANTHFWLGNASYAFQLRRTNVDNPRTTLQDTGWMAYVRMGTVNYQFSRGTVNAGAVVGAVDYVQVDTDWVRIIFKFDNSGDTPVTLDFDVTGNPRLGEEPIPNVSMNSIEQRVINIVGNVYTLSFIQETALDSVLPELNNFDGRTAFPMNQSAPFISFVWAGRTIAAGRSLEIAFFVGVGDAPFSVPPSPTPIPQAPLQFITGQFRTAFNLNYLGSETTNGDSGWKARLRPVNGAELLASYGLLMANGGAAGWIINGGFEYDQIGPFWLRITTVLTNSGNKSVAVDLALSADLRGGANSVTMSTTMQSLDQEVLPFIGTDWSLNVLRRSIGGLELTPLDIFAPAASAFDQVSVPYSGAPLGVTFGWLNRTVPAGGELRLSTVIGGDDGTVALPPTPTPAPSAGFLAQMGNSSAAWNMRWHGARTTYGDNGWKCYVYAAGTSTFTQLMSGKGQLQDVSIQMRFEPFGDNYQRIVFVLTNNGAKDFAVDVVPFGDVEAGGTDVVRLVVNQRGQPIFTFPGANWDLTWFARPVPGIDVTPISGWWPANSGAGPYRKSAPFNGTADGIQWQWPNVNVPAGQTVELSTMFGVGDPGVPTPSPLPPAVVPSLFVQDGDISANGAFAFNIRRLGVGTTLNDYGYKVLIRRTDSHNELDYVAGGEGSIRGVEVDTQYEQLSDTWVKIVFKLNSVGSARANVDLLVTGAPYFQGAVNFSLFNRKQPVLTFRRQWELNFIVQPIDGAEVTGIDTFQPGDESWESVGAPYERAGITHFSMSWLDRRVPLAGTTELSFIVGYGDPPGFTLPPAPTPYPQFPLMVTEGNTSHLMNVRYNSQPSTTSDFGWMAVMRNATHNVHFSNGMATLGTVSASVSFERLGPAWVRPVVTFQNEGTVTAVVDFLISASVRLGHQPPLHASVSFIQRDQPSIVLVGDMGWNLTIVTEPLPGADVTPLSGLGVQENTFNEVALPYSGRPSYVSFFWLGRVVPFDEPAEVATIFGVGEPPFYIPPMHTPRPTPYPLEVSFKGGVAFQMRWLGQPTTEGDSGWRGILRLAGAFEEETFNNGASSSGEIKARVRMDHISPSYVKMTVSLTKDSDGSANADFMLWAPLRLGDDASLPSVAMATKDYPVMSFVGRNWTLNVVTGTVNDVTNTPITAFYPGKASWWDELSPYFGTPQAVSFSWQNVTVTHGEATQISMVFGVGPMPFTVAASPTPAPTPADLTFEPGRDGTAFNMKYYGRETTFMNNGWQARIRSGDRRDSCVFSYGKAEIPGISTVVQLKQISDRWGFVSFVISNAQPDPTTVDLQMWALPRMGSDNEVAYVQIVNMSQGAVTFSSRAFSLQLVTRPAEGVASVITPPSRFDVTMGSWGEVSMPYWGYPSQVTWSWMDVEVPALDSTRVEVIFGVGYPDFPTPRPLPQQPLFSVMGQAGNATYAFNLRYLRRGTTTRDEGWTGLLRVNGRGTETYFSRGVARLNEINATVRIEQISDGWIAAVFTITNRLDIPVAADLLFGCDTAADTINFQELAAGNFRFTTQVSPTLVDTWDLKIMRYRANGAPCNTIDRFTPNRESWEAARSFAGHADSVSFAWVNREVSPRGMIELRTIFGVGDQPRWPTPVATPSVNAPPSATASRSRTPVLTQTQRTPVPEATLAGSEPGLVSPKSGMSGGAIAGVVVAVVAVVAIAGVAAWCFVHRKPTFAEDDELQAELVSEPEFKGLYT